MEAAKFSSPVECYDMVFETAEGLAAHQQMHQEEAPQRIVENEHHQQATQQQRAPSQIASRDLGGEDIKPFPCNVEGCSKSYRQMKTLRDHARSVHQVAVTLQFKCLVPGCDSSFASQGGLTCHNKKCHLPHEEKRYKCLAEGCQKAYASDRGLAYHMGVKHPEEGNTLPHKCPAEGCSFAGSKLKDLKYHQGPAHGVWRCSAALCQFSCTDLDELCSHRAMQHNLTTPLKCFRLASQNTTTQSSSSIHRSQDHNDTEDSEASEDEDSVKSEEESEPERPYPCPGGSCSYRHRAPWGILKHWQASHQGQNYPAQDDSSISQPSSSNSRVPIRSHSVIPQTTGIHSGAHLSNSRSEATHLRSPRTHSSTPQLTSLPLPVSSSPHTTSIVENISTIENRIALQNRTSPMVKEEQRDASMPPPPNPAPNSQARATTTRMSDHGSRSPTLFVDVRTNKPKPTPKKLGVRAFANMALFNQQNEGRDLRPTPRPPLRTKEASLDSAFDDENSDSDNELSPTPDDTIRSKTVGSSFHSNDPFYNPDDSDANNALTKLTPPAPVLAKSTNADEFMSFSTYITDPLLSSYIKKKKTTGTIVKPKEVAMSFHTEAETMPASRVRRLRLWEEEKVRKVAEDKAAEAEANRKRKRGTCAGPPRVKRKYQWKNGFCERKRPSERAKDKDKEGDNGGGMGGASAGAAAMA